MHPFLCRGLIIPWHQSVGYLPMLEEHNQSTYRYVMGQSDVEDIIRFLRNKEWVSRRADTSWNLVGHMNRNIKLIRQPHVEDGGGVLLVGRLTAVPCYLRRRGLETH